jgi:toxin ParE1/3/4
MPQALEDLRGVEEFIGKDNPVAAVAFVEKLTERFNELVDAPGIGRKREEFAPGLRSSRVGDYLIFYRISGKFLEIIHVLHGARDLPSFFQQD